MSTNIKMRCIDQVLAFESTPVIASGGLEEDTLQVSFCSKWDGLAKTAVFWLTEDEAYHVTLDLNDSCVIPREVLADEGVFYFGIFGVSESGRQRTTEAVRYTIAKGAITAGTKPSDPTPDVYTQLLAKYAETQAIAQQAVAEAGASAAAAANTLAELEEARAEALAEMEASRLAAESAAADAERAAGHTHTAADVGAAPAGFGLGETSLKNISDLNDFSLPSGLYRISASTANKPNGVTYGFVDIKKNGQNVTQVINELLYGMLIVRVSIDSTTWQEPLYFNPRLDANAEYKTAEYIRDKAVYKRYNNSTGTIEYRLDGETEWKPYLNANGNAPAGFGLGTVDSKALSGVDLNTVTAGGTYKITTGCSNTPPGVNGAWSKLLVIPDRACTQVWFPANDQSKPDFCSTCLMRIYNEDTKSWGAWEWVNPPMALGVEYRTTERINGKAVYKKNDNGVIKYRLDGETEWKPYASAVGGVSKAGGDTLTTTLYYGNKKKALAWHDNDLGFIVTNAEGDSANSTRFMVANSNLSDLANAVWLSRYVNGVETKYPVLHTGNVPNAGNFITGSYVGTGTVGANGKNELTFPFEPKYVVVYQVTGLGGLAMEFLRPLAVINVTRSIPSSSSFSSYAEWDGKTLRWWVTKRESLIDGGSGTPTAGSQSNEGGQTYYYAAWG